MASFTKAELRRASEVADERGRTVAVEKRPGGVVRLLMIKADRAQGDAEPANEWDEVLAR